MSVKDFVLVIAYGLPPAAVVAVLGGVLLHLLRRCSVRRLQFVVATATVLATVVGTFSVSAAMLPDSHETTVTLVVVAMSACAGLAAAWLLGRRVSIASGALADAAQVVGEGYRSPSDLPAELRRVSAQLAVTDEKLLRAREREAALEDSRRNLVAWMSHDLRTPLAGIRAMAEALEDGVVDDPATMNRYHGQIREETDRLAGMVDDLFELSRIHAGSLRLTRQPIGLTDLVADAVASVTPVAEAKGVRLVDLASGDTMVELDPDGMGRVLRNLLVNAIKHTPADGVVEVTGAVEADVASIGIRDACGGIAEHDLPHVFDVAFRGESARTPTAGGGGGLGLAIARGIVEAHSGDIDVQNTDVGCEFQVSVPTGGAR